MRTRTLMIALVACLISVGLATQEASAERNRALKHGAGIRGHGPGQGGLLQQLASQGSHSRQHGSGTPQWNRSRHSGNGGQSGHGFGQGGLLQQLVSQSPVFQQNGHGESRHFGNSGRHGERGSRGGWGPGSGHTPLLDAIQGAAIGAPGWNSYRDCDRGYGQRYDRYSGHGNDYAGAYRDVGIANAVVDLFGNLAVMSMQNGPRYAVPVGAYPAAPVAAYAPAPVAYPSGHYETERVLVNPGHYEEIKVWIPEGIDPQTGARTGGYYEARQRWIPEVYEYRPVWVTQ